MSDVLRPILRRQVTDVNRLYATLGDAIANAFARQERLRPPDAPITERDRQAVMREVQRGLDVIYGRYPGDPDAALRQVVVRDADAARFAPLDAAVRQWRGAMTPTLRDRIDSEVSP